MIIEPVIQGVIARSAHPEGCKAAINEQINFVKQSPQIQRGPKRVLILGASSGFGLAARIALTFGGAQADTIGVSFERGPSEKGVGTAGYYNNIHFKQAAEEAGRIAVNIQGDAFSQTTREQVIEAIETYFEGEVDLIIYSIATGVRPKPTHLQRDAQDKVWRSSIKPINAPLSGASIDLNTDTWTQTQLEPASEQEIEDTIHVMGGSDWESWIDTLINAESIAPGCQTIAFSYIGSKLTHPIYRDGTLGWAKVDLHQASHSLNLKLANFDGSAHACVCKALMTKASVFIPAFMPYMLALTKVMKEQGVEEDCIAQMQRLFRDKIYNGEKVEVDSERLIRIDDKEMKAEVQSQVRALVEQMNQDNFQTITDYQSFKQDFLKMNGFGFEHIDYQKPVDLSFYQDK
ncbi:MAG: enoyl-ACP reductase FabV [Vibrio sp.]